jgi:hypothetical protein
MIVRPEDAVSWIARYQPRWNALFADTQNLVVLLDVVRTKLLEPMPAPLAAALRKSVAAFETSLTRLVADIHADVYDRDLAESGSELELQDLERRCAFLMGKLDSVVKGVDKLVA